MKIWGGVPNVSGVYGKQASVNKVSKTSEVTAKKDVVSISKESLQYAKDFQTVMSSINKVPDIRQDKVAEVASRYEAGKQPESKDVADKILKSTIDSRV